MNRTIALFLALAVLTAHALAIYQAGNGDLAPPYEFAHVAYRLGRNLAQTGRLVWDSSMGDCEAYPSLLWIGVSALAERAYTPVTQVTQGIGITAALLTVLVVARFSPKRLAGVIAPLLLVVSGGLAASSLSGTEIPVLTLLVSASFLFFERRSKVALSICLPLLAAARTEGAVFVLALALLEGLGYLRKRPEVRASTLFPAFVPVAFLALIAIGWRLSRLDTFFSPTLESLLIPNTQAIRPGLRSIRDLLVGLGAPALIIFPLWYMARGHLISTGRRALCLSLLWILMIANSGGTHLPFAGELVPMLPLLYVSIQEAMTLALDSSKRGLPQLSWGLFALGMTSSALASKYPGDLGPLPVEAAHRSWQHASSFPRIGRTAVLGRLGLDEEIKLTERLRALGLFLRDHLDPSLSLLSPWPGSVGYLSQLRVIDPLGRVTRLSPTAPLRSLGSARRTDLRAVLTSDSDYLVPTLTTSGRTPNAMDLADGWARTMDNKPWSEERTGELLQLMGEYEMLAVPLEYEGRTPSAGAAKFFLMRKRYLGLAPLLHVDVADGRFEVEVSHASHVQLADLEIILRDRRGKRWSMRPTGKFTLEPTLARTNLLISSTENRRVLLASGQIPEGLDARELRVALRNPSAKGNDIFTNVGKSVAVSW